MVGECVRILFMSCEGSLNERVRFFEIVKRTNHEVICLLYECKDEGRDTEYFILTDNKIHKRNIKINFLTIYCFVSRNVFL